MKTFEVSLQTRRCAVNSDQVLVLERTDDGVARIHFVDTNRNSVLTETPYEQVLQEWKES